MHAMFKTTLVSLLSLGATSVVLADFSSDHTGKAKPPVSAPNAIVRAAAGGYSSDNNPPADATPAYQSRGQESAANGGFSSDHNPPKTNSGSGYYSDHNQQASGTGGYYSKHQPKRPAHRGSSESYTVTVNTPGFSGYYSDRDDTYFVSDAGIREKFSWPRWLPSRYGRSIPVTSVIGGRDPDSGEALYVCRADFEGNIYPGKLSGGKCHFTTRGQEIRAARYEVLVSHKPLRWKGASFGHIPRKAIFGGQTRGEPVYICQADYQGGRIPGKIVSRACKIGFNGEEIAIPYYNVLVR